MSAVHWGISAAATAILLGTPAYAAWRHRAHMRSRVRFKRQFKGRELLAHAYLLYLAVAVVSGGLPLGVLRLYALIPKVPAPDVAWSYLGCAVVGVASALAFVPKTYEAVERSDE